MKTTQITAQSIVTPKAFDHHGIEYPHSNQILLKAPLHRMYFPIPVPKPTFRASSKTVQDYTDPSYRS